MLPLFVAASAGAGVLIDGTTGNGGFVNTSADLNVTSLTGWTASKGVWIVADNSSLTTPPFGADTATNSRYIQIHNDAGEVLTSTAMFSVSPGDVINLSLDHKVGGSNLSPALTITLWDSVANTTYATLGTISTSTAQASFKQMDYTYTATVANSNLCLRFTLAAAGGNRQRRAPGPCLSIRRIHHAAAAHRLRDVAATPGQRHPGADHRKGGQTASSGEPSRLAAR